jgi:hypothetical protein
MTFTPTIGSPVRVVTLPVITQLKLGSPWLEATGFNKMSRTTAQPDRMNSRLIASTLSVNPSLELNAEKA